MRKLLLLCLLMFMLLPGHVMAAKYITAVYGSNEDGFRIASQDAKTFRMDFLHNGEPTGEYFLMNKNGRWFVSPGDANKLEALDMVEFYKAEEITAEDFKDDSANITKTDRKAIVGGIEGFVWEEVDTFWGGKNELVLTTNKDMVMLTKGLVQFFNDFAIVTFFLGGNGPASLIVNINETEKTEYGFLKYKGDELTSLGKVEYPKDYFQLPKNVEMMKID